jgi:transposase InsO family protein
MPDETSRRYLFVAIHRATRWVFLHIHNDMNATSSIDFLRWLKETSPIKISKILTDNGSQFTDRFTSKDKQPSGRHVFDRVCAGMGIEHRLAPPRHPQTNGMVERFNGRISELLQQTRFDSLGRLREDAAQLPQAVQPSHTAARYRFKNSDPGAQRMATAKARSICKTGL